MKKLLLLLTLITSLVALPPIAGAKDKDRDKDHDRDRKEEGDRRWKEARDQVRSLREKVGRLEETARREDLGRRARGQISYCSGEMQRINADFDRGYTDRDFRDRLARLDDAISRARQSVEEDRQYRGRYRR